MASGAFEQFPASLAAGIADANIEKFPENPTMTENPNETTTTHPAESGNLKMQDIPSTSTTEPASTTHTSNHSRTLSEETLVDPSHPPGDHVPNNKEAKTFSHAIAEEHDPTQLSPSEQVQSHGLMAGKSVSDHDYQDPEKVLGTLTKEDFWLLVRRFNKVCEAESRWWLCGSNRYHGAVRRLQNGADMRVGGLANSICKDD